MNSLIVVSLCWLLSEIILSRFLRSDAKDNKDQQTLQYLWITITISVSTGVYLGIKRIGFFPYASPLVQQIGLIAIILGLIVRWMAILTLKRHFTVNVAVRQNQKIVNRGLYRHIRHPAYLGSLLSFLGLGMAFSNWLSVLVVILPVTAAFLKRIKIEEKVLSDSFGDDYVNYMKHTKRIIPGIY